METEVRPLMPRSLAKEPLTSCSSR